MCTIHNSDLALLIVCRTIKTTAGLSATLSTINYSLYILAHLHASSPSRVAIIGYISKLIGRDVKIPASALTPAPSPLVPLGAMVADFRSMFRLTGLLSLYVLLKSLVNQKGGDALKHRIQVVQCLGYIGFQFTENVLVLTNKGVLKGGLVARMGGPANAMKWGCRSWLVGVSTDYLRLWRDAALMRDRKAKGESISAKEQEEFDRKWWIDLQTCTSWLPMALHYSIEGGLPGMNSGLVGLCGFLAGINNTRAAWKAAAA